MSRSLAVLAIVWAIGVPANAHTLGVDPADLVEKADGYELIARVPPAYQSAIRPPTLPPTCRIEGSPRGIRGAYEVRFAFTCVRPLAVGDVLTLPWQQD